MKNIHQNGSVNGNLVSTEQAQRASELSYRRLFKAARDGILILDVLLTEKILKMSSTPNPAP